MTSLRYPSIQDNYERGMGFLQLAVEQLRAYDAETARTVETIFFAGLRDVFDCAGKRMNDDDFALENQLQSLALNQPATTFFDNASFGPPLAPPGLGFSDFPQARNRVNRDTGGLENIPLEASIPLFRNTSNGSRNVFASDTPPDRWSPMLGTTIVPSNARSRTISGSFPPADFGIIGQRKPSSSIPITNTTKRRTSTLAELCQDSEPLHDSGVGSLASGIIVPVADLKPLPYHLSRFGLVSEQELFSADTNNAIKTGLRLFVDPRSLSGETAVLDQEDTPAAPPQPIIEPVKAISTWASVAAISDRAKAASHFSGHLTTALTKAQARLNPIRRSTPSNSRPTEPEEQQYRCVWLADLPVTFTLRDVSRRIDLGPVMSICLCAEVEGLTGNCACIIFQLAEDALAFVKVNEIVTANTDESRRPPAARYLADAPNAYILLGAPYPAEENILAMAVPTYARRRLKWSRSRLFYDVPLAKFKEDIYEIVGAENVELFHFYNPGECTVVFASVKVAAACYQEFAKFKKEVAERDADGNLYGPALVGRPGMLGRTTSSVTGTTNGGKKGKIGEVGGGELGGRYERVDVSYVHDFNEAPARLFSQYGLDGKVRKTSSDVGVEGLYGGPIVIVGRP